jgi:hypothetical protein
VRTDRFLVRGRACLEVRTTKTVDTRDGCRIHFDVEPRLIEVPPAAHADVATEDRGERRVHE